jgi:hypothetical protein
MAKQKDARDNDNLFDWEQEPCNNCKKYKTYEGHDGCLGELDGVANACCGHGKISKASIQFFDGTCIFGAPAIIIQKVLKQNKSNTSLERRVKFLKGAVRFLEDNEFEYFKQI